LRFLVRDSRCDIPQLAHLTFRRPPIASQSMKRLKFAIVERDAERGL
jgi:hypothetical protein